MTFTEKELYCNKWVTTKALAFVNQRTGETQTLDANTPIQVEDFRENHVTLRAKYPNDAYFVQTITDSLKEGI